MSHYDDGHASLQTQLSDVQGRLATLPKARRESVQAELARLEDALGFAAIVIDHTAPELVPDATHPELTGALTQISDQIVEAGADPGPYTEATSTPLRAFPPPRVR